MTISEPASPLVENKAPSDGAVLAGFLIFNALFRFFLLRLNGGEYTDGILQIAQFQRHDSFWPPLYTALVWAVRACGVEPIMAGRFVSWAASVLLILPLWYVARSWGGRRAALFTAALYTASPSALRWSLRVMTDMPFAFLFHLACAGLLGYWACGREEEGFSARRSGTRVAWITVVAVLATLTRYQGLLLAPLVLIALLQAWRRRAPGWRTAALAQGLWLALPVWFHFQRFEHAKQVVERAPEGFWAWSTLVNYWYTFEMFVFLIPYFLTLPVCIFFLYGVFRGPAPGEDAAATGAGDGRCAMPVRGLLLYAALVVLAAQSVFQSFQSRYLLPLVPLALTCAGVGMARMERHFAAGRGAGGGLARCRPWGHGTVLAFTGITLVWSLGFALASVFLQRGAFADVFEAGRYIRALNLPPTTPVFSNETYKPRINGVKLAFAAGRPVEIIPEIVSLGQVGRVGQVGPGGPAFQAGGATRMPPGSVVAVHSAYAGGFEGQARFIRFLRGSFGYNLRPLEKGIFTSWLVPLLPDIMEEPLTHQNPLAWLLRYRRQDFRTELFVVEK